MNDKKLELEDLEKQLLILIDLDSDVSDIDNIENKINTLKDQVG